MKTDELSAWLATEVMGWHRGRGKNKQYSDRFYDSSGKRMYWVEGFPEIWNPTEDIAQAMMCLVKNGGQFSIWYDHHYFIMRHGDCYKSDVSLTELPKAICECIREAGGKE